MAGSLSVFLSLYIVTANPLFGLVAGYLFWRHGLESAMLAHLLAHLLAYIVLSTVVSIVMAQSSSLFI